MSISDVLQKNAEESTADWWLRFSSSEDEEEYAQSWLALQCSFVRQCAQAVLVRKLENGSFAPVAHWPVAGGDPVRLTDVLEQVIEEECGIISELGQGSGKFGLAFPLLIDGRLVAIVALEIFAGRDVELQEAMQQLQWGVAWLELRYRRQQAGRDAAALSRLRAAVDLLSVALGEERFSGAAMAFVTELASATGCSRVSIGFLKGGSIRVEAVSNSADFNQKMSLPKGIALAMDEALLQRKEVLYPPAPGSDLLILRDHEALARQQNIASVITFPLFGQNRYYGAMTCERSENTPFSNEEIEFFRAIAAMVGPALDAKELNDRPLHVKIRNAAGTQLTRLLGAGYPKRKLFAFIVLLAVVFFSLATGDYRLTADTIIEGDVRRAVVAPFDGYIDQTAYRAGDTVENGAVLCTLDDRDLRLEKLTRVSQRSQLQKQLQEAQAKHDRAQASIVRAMLEQVDAELQQTEAKLGRTRLKAPFAGLLVSGDLSQRLGGAVKQGELLFEVTPLDAYRVILKVDERRIADVRVGQQGTLVLSSQPERQFPFAISKITPIATAEEGRNYFRVEARLAENSEELRPGMEGVGKIYIDQRKLISIWTRNLVEWSRLWLWSWLP